MSATGSEETPGPDSKKEVGAERLEDTAAASLDSPFQDSRQGLSSSSPAQGFVSGTLLLPREGRSGSEGDDKGSVQHQSPVREAWRSVAQVGALTCAINLRLSEARERD